MLGLRFEWALEVLTIFLFSGTTFDAVLSASSVLSFESFPSFHEEGLVLTAEGFFVFDALLLEF